MSEGKKCLICNDCKSKFSNSELASNHAKETGHRRFKEVENHD